MPMEAGPMQGIAEAIDEKEEAGRNGFTPARAIDSPRKQSLTVAASDPAIRRGGIVWSNGRPQLMTCRS